jgi:hypothetical protein
MKLHLNFVIGSTSGHMKRNRQRAVHKQFILHTLITYYHNKRTTNISPLLMRSLVLGIVENSLNHKTVIF